MPRMLARTLPVVLSVIFLAGCLEYGKVDQGRTVAVDTEKRTVTFIRSMSADSRQSDFMLPAVTFAFPTDPEAMGPQPRAGLRLRLDIAKSLVVLYAPEKQRFETIPIHIVDKQEGIDARHPLVYDAAAQKPKPFPVVDTEKKIVTLYFQTEKELVSFIPPDEYLVLPAAAWDSGDVVRIYYKEEGQALRLMNVTRTDIFKK